MVVVPLRSDWSQANCPIARSLDVVGDAWTLLIMREAFMGLTRYEQFRDKLGIADNVLSRRLQAMVENDLLRKTPYRADQRTHEEYRLTAAGADLLPVLHALGSWGSRHTETPPDGGRTRIIHLPCGRVTKSTDRCTYCDVPLTSSEVAWDRPWASPEPIPLATADSG
jgi:DNA-binding HxlR family transcriptional regulator